MYPPPCLATVDIAPLKLNYNGRVFPNPNKNLAPGALQRDQSKDIIQSEGPPLLLSFFHAF